MLSELKATFDYVNDDVCNIYATVQLERSKIISEVRVSRGDSLKFGVSIIMLRQAGLQSFTQNILS